MLDEECLLLVLCRKGRPSSQPAADRGGANEDLVMMVLSRPAFSSVTHVRLSHLGERCEGQSICVRGTEYMCKFTVQFDLT